MSRNVRSEDGIGRGAYRLIEDVHHYRVLYDTSHADYMKGNCKDEICAEIASSLQLKDGKQIIFPLAIERKDKFTRDSY